MLGVSSRRQQAKTHLLGLGARTVGALRRGLQHPNPEVRRACVNLLDHFVDDESLPALVAAVDDPDPHVSARALHALACDRCKENACRPAEDLWVPRALDIVRSHPHPRVRASAIDALGKVVRRRPEVADALAEVAETDRVAGLRTMARRLTPVRV